MTGPTHLTWDNFRKTCIVPGRQSVHRVGSTPGIEIFGDSAQSRVGAWLRVPQGTPVPNSLAGLASIEARIVERNNSPTLELAVSDPNLHRDFYYFALAVSERVLVEGRAPAEAVSIELGSFGDLVAEQRVLGFERQLGLVGELVVLQRLVAQRGAAALDAWIGSKSEPHDFRIGTVELEVKTTLKPARIHTINGLSQLLPTEGCSLYVFSIMLAPAGAATGGFSLQSLALSLQARLERESGRAQQFMDALENYGYDLAHSDLYGLHDWVFRRPSVIAEVDESFPKLTRPAIELVAGNTASRIDGIQYDVNIEGLGFADGTVQFAHVFPA